MLCINCGARLPAGAKYCLQCGAAQPPDQRQQAADTQMEDRVTRLYSRGVITVLILIVGFLLALKYFAPSILGLEFLKWLVYAWIVFSVILTTAGLRLAVWVQDRRAKRRREAPESRIGQLEARVSQLSGAAERNSNEKQK